MKQLIQIQQTSLQERIHDNIAATLLGIKFHGAESSELENELVEALKEKYDAMKEKIYEEALKKYVTWLQNFIDIFFTRT